MASVQAVVLTEQTSDHDPVQTLTPAQVQWTPYPPPPPNPARIQYALGPGMHNGAWHVDLQYKTGMSMIWQDGDADIVVQNLTITSAVDAVDGHYGFCLYDPADTGADDGNPAHDVMRVTVDVADYPLPSYDNPTTVTVKWYDCFGIVMLREKNATINLGMQEATAHVEWQTNGPGGATLTSTKLLAIDPGLGIQVRDASHGVPNQFGSNQYNMENLLQAPANPDGKWTFLVQVKDAAGATDRAHANKYAQLKGDKAWRNWPADDDRYNVNYDYDGFAAARQDGPFPDGSSYEATAWGDSAGIADVQHFVERWQTSRVICHFDHGDPGFAGFAPFQGTQACIYLCDNIPSNIDPQLHYLFRRIDDYRGDVRLAVFHSCGSGVTETMYSGGNLAEAAARAGAESALGFPQWVDVGEKGYYWECALWLYLASVDDNDKPPTLQQACAYADALFKEHFSYSAEDYNLKPRYCFGSVNWGQTLWPAG